MRSLLVDMVYKTLQILAWAILRLGFRLQVHGRQHVPRLGGFILASNHFSYMDPIVLGAACPRRLVFVARADLLDVPRLGPFMRLMQTIPVHHGEVDVSLREAVRLLRSDQPVAIFPEGGRQFSGTVGVAKPGVGLLATSAQVPIVPVLLKGTFEALPPTARRLRPTKIRVAFGPKIVYPEGRLSREAYETLANEVTASWRRLAGEW